MSREYITSFKITVKTSNNQEVLTLKKADDGKWNRENIQDCLKIVLEKAKEWSVQLDPWAFRFASEEAARNGELTPKEKMTLLSAVVKGKLPKTIKVYPNKWGAPVIRFYDPKEAPVTSTAPAKPKREA